jgi:hypothetical protein
MIMNDDSVVSELTNNFFFLLIYTIHVTARSPSHSFMHFPTYHLSSSCGPRLSGFSSFTRRIFFLTSECGKMMEGLEQRWKTRYFFLWLSLIGQENETNWLS